ncbi:MAG: hypothetical protein J6Y02_03675 [Pseudobutyrivibrio sp.]|nr:hypothetical protein [Pseudobutyrivibrio sp.]
MSKRLIAMDIETKDPNLHDLGDGSIRCDGYILCCGAHGDGISKVFDFQNPNDIQECKDLVEDPDIDLIFHNGLYDLSWMYNFYGFRPKGIMHDTMTRAALIDEYQSLGLDDCCKRLGVTGKNKSETIEAWWSEHQEILKKLAKGLKKYGVFNDSEVMDPDTMESFKLNELEMESLITGNYKKDVWANVDVVWNDPEGRELMKKYNLQDCVATYNLFKAQEPKMKGLEQVYELECKLIPILLEMKRVGIRIDEDALHKLADKVQSKYDQIEQQLITMYGITGEMINSSKQLGARLNEMNIQSPVRTRTGAQSWSADALARIHHPVIPMIQEFKNYEAILNKYLHGSLSRTIVDGRIHCTFVPMLRDQGDGGTVTGRFSCKNPNLQQIPARNKGHGDDFSQDMRALFLPEEGQMLAAMDYSQIEAVLLGHFAQGPQAEWFREQLRGGADLHNIAMDMTGITYRPVVKTFNYGCIYGMGWKTAMDKNYTLFEKLAKEEGLDVETFTRDIYYNYHKKFPVVKDTMEWCQNVAKMQGYIDTMGGRRLHKPKPQYDPATGKINDFIYKMLNKLIQGTAADILKTAIVQAYEEGIYDILTLHLLVHDEQVNSVPFTKVGTEAAVELQHIMGNVYHDKLLVPIKASCELGPNWGYWSDRIYKDMQAGIFDPKEFKADYKETH